jgi:hypothetical protein
MKEASPVLAWSGAIALLWSMATLVLPLVDPRLFQGVSVWHKPWKFQISVGIYWLTLVLFMTYLAKPSKPSKVWRFVIWISFAGGAFEVLYITWQAALGQASHYNVSTAFHAYMYTAMGVGAVLLTSTSGIVGYLILKQTNLHMNVSHAMQQAIGWSLLITSTLGIVTGGVLGERTRSGGHWVGGTANDAFGIFMLNWSRDGGDLRVAHFFALHAMQILPLTLVVLYLVMPALRRDTNQKTAKQLVWFLALLLSLACVFTLWQALKGIPFLR